ncbi:ATP-binding protein [Absiella sp. AM09-50]|jgi:ABC-type Na+ transport system ATPase subunit NatA|nr:ATP-binding protein [Absiella sp. AM22-9]RGB60745.1 ATP-binding protein [Absiella sp. AM10-20]RGB69242.1 ATP-binding protein [Absiella sp. AM09-45]RGB79224.1 ATP-binding protein [Absiella sp. AM09-50]RHU02599.1 ATP-binding protein [Absiella sp. AM27-20]
MLRNRNLIDKLYSCVTMNMEVSYMNNLVRIEQIEINGIKNILHGEVAFQEYSEILKGDFDDIRSTFHPVLGIYGQNGSGKSAVLETTKILKTIMSGECLPKNIDQYINNEKHEANLIYTFLFIHETNMQLVEYHVKIELEDGNFNITSEKLLSKSYDKDKKKWKPQVILIQTDFGDITLKKLKNKISKDLLIELRVVKDMQKDASFIFYERNRNSLISELKDKNEDYLIKTIEVLNIFAQTGLIIIENDVMGSINMNTFMPISVYLPVKDSLKLGEIPVNILEPNEMPLALFHDMEKIIQQIDLVISAIIPSLNIQIIHKKEQLLKDGSMGMNFEVVSVRNAKFIPLKYESEGIKRIISVTSSLIAAYNNNSLCLMIDEFDSGIYEYLLGELLEIMNESAKGQFVFTSHNLRPLEKLSYKSIIFTTVNPTNRFIRLTGVKPNNNIRDYYYTNIMLGGQSEQLYEETKNYEIKRAFRKAGKLYE